MQGIDVARKYLGLQEIKDKKALMAFLKSQSIRGDIAIDPSITSWCAAFVNACERSVGKPGTGKLNAQSFRTYGDKVEIDDAEEGDIMVFHFPSDASWQGHVTYFVKYDDKNNLVDCLGGNQHNMVCYSNYIQDYITDIRRHK